MKGRGCPGMGGITCVWDIAGIAWFTGITCVVGVVRPRGAAAGMIRVAVRSGSVSPVSLVSLVSLPASSQSAVESSSPVSSSSPCIVILGQAWAGMIRVEPGRAEEDKTAVCASEGSSSSFFLSVSSPSSSSPSFSSFSRSSKEGRGSVQSHRGLVFKALAASL